MKHIVPLCLVEDLLTTSIELNLLEVIPALVHFLNNQNDSPDIDTGFQEEQMVRLASFRKDLLKSYGNKPVELLAEDANTH